MKPIEKVPHCSALHTAFDEGALMKLNINDTFLRRVVRKELKDIAFTKTHYRRRFGMRRGQPRKAIGIRTEQGVWVEVVLPAYDHAGQRTSNALLFFRGKTAPTEEDLERAMWSLTRLLHAEIAGSRN